MGHHPGKMSKITTVQVVQIAELLNKVIEDDGPDYKRYKDGWSDPKVAACIDGPELRATQVAGLRTRLGIRFRPIPESGSTGLLPKPVPAVSGETAKITQLIGIIEDMLLIQKQTQDKVNAMAVTLARVAEQQAKLAGAWGVQ